MITNPNKLLEEHGYRVVSTDRKRILRHIKKYPYIEVNIEWFDVDKYPDECVWYDVEGMGYGWLFLHNKPKEYLRLIRNYARRVIVEEKLYQKMGIIKDENSLIFAVPSNDLQCVYVVKLSNEEDSKYFF